MSGTQLRVGPSSVQPNLLAASLKLPAIPVAGKGPVLLAGSGPANTRKFFPDPSSGNQGALNVRNSVWFGRELEGRALRLIEIRNVAVVGREAHVLDNVAGYTRVASTLTPIFNPTLANGRVDVGVYIVALGKNYTMGVQRNNTDAATPTKPNPQARSRIVATTADDFAAQANQRQPGNIPLVLTNGGFFDNYDTFAHSTMAAVNKGEVLATGAVGPGRKVLFLNKNNGEGFKGDASTSINFGAQPVVNGMAQGRYSQDFRELKNIVGRASAFTALDPGVADRAHAEEIQRQVVYGTNASGEMFMLVSGRGLSQIDAVAQMRRLVGSKGVIGVGDGGDSAALSAWNGREYVNLVTSTRPVNAAITFSKVLR
jgi:hypothetical protein